MESNRLEPGEWRGEPATQAQIDYLRSIGVPVGAGITRGRAHEIIEGPATKEQLQRLNYYGIPIPKSLGRREATELIGSYISQHPTSERQFQRYAAHDHSMGRLLRLLVLCGVLLVSTMAYNRWLKKRDATAYHPPAPASTPLPAQPAPAALPTIISAPQANPPSAQARAVALYPALARAGSPLNVKFLQLVQQHQHTDPDIFNDPEWPTQIAREADQYLNDATHPASTPP